jgi:hypothetical protein
MKDSDIAQEYNIEAPQWAKTILNPFASMNCCKSMWTFACLTIWPAERKIALFFLEACFEYGLYGLDRIVSIRPVGFDNE